MAKLGMGDVPKVADFGLARDVSSGAAYYGQKSAFPIDWAAPEVLDEKRRRFSKKSDVYSFGCLLWEMWRRPGKHGFCR